MLLEEPKPIQEDKEKFKMGVVVKGSFKNTEKFLKRAEKRDFYDRLDEYGRKGVAALSAATPVDSGKTAESWDYEIHYGKDTITISWTNSNVVDGYAVIAVLIQYGHGTRNGGYVQGRDYINPAMRPVFDDIANAVWEEVRR